MKGDPSLSIIFLKPGQLLIEKKNRFFIDSKEFDLYSNSLGSLIEYRSLRGILF